ncbi:SDR family oxidoreductase [Nocardia pseudovaccinii]|uniref:SDR family oxidoreductase n=1 Tax=Nocardia pseudovaccinii TaxID=189540 RepID=UPI0007A50F6E|nr:NmrA family NAD(P)-binding protein [Nocardia pseudovaccinii]
MTGEIVVAGASGSSGRPLLAELLRQGVAVSAITHSADGAERLSALGASSVRHADFGDESALRGAFEGARAVYVIPPVLHPLEDEFVINAVRAATGAGVERFVYHSVLHPYTPALRNHLRKARAEAAVRDSSLRWTILQPSMYAQVVLAMLNGGGPEVSVPFDLEAPVSVLDLAELAEVGAKVLTEDGHEYASYELAGPLTTMKQMVAAIAAQRGVALRPVLVPPTSAPLPPAALEKPMAAADMISTFAHYDAHGFRGNPAVFQYLLGRAPNGFAQVVDRELGNR